MAQLLITYNQPADPVAFETYYFDTHVPIFAKTPHVRSVVFSRAPISSVIGL